MLLWHALLSSTKVRHLLLGAQVFAIFTKGGLLVCLGGVTFCCLEGKEEGRGSESESELFTGDTSKDNHSPRPVFREVSP